MSLLVSFLITGTKHLIHSRRNDVWLMVSDGADWPAGSKQKHHDGKSWLNKTVQFMAANKQSRGCTREEGARDLIQIPGLCLYDHLDRSRNVPY